MIENYTLFQKFIGSMGIMILVVIILLPFIIRKFPHKILPLDQRKRGFDEPRNSSKIFDDRLKKGPSVLDETEEAIS